VPYNAKVVKGSRPKRFALFVLCGLVGVVVVGCGTASRTPAPSHRAAMKRYRDSAGWTVAYPRAFRVEHSATHGDLTDFDEVTVGSFSMPRAIHISRSSTRILPPRTSSGTFPPDGIAFRVLRVFGGPGPLVVSAESHFPLRLSSFHRSVASPRIRTKVVVADGGAYYLTAWIAPKADRSRQRQLERLVASMAFPRLHAGGTIGNLGVFARATHYPVGSFTRVRVEGFPFYLVHAPGGWYAVGWKWGVRFAGAYKRRCRLQLDRATSQFFCTNMRARWDRAGRVIAKPSPASPPDPLDLNVVTLSWDGHVLVDPGASNGLSASYAHKLWPNVYP
jgi:hypothetical protein